MLSIQAVVELDKLGGQGRSRVSIMQGANGELMGRSEKGFQSMMTSQVRQLMHTEESVEQRLPLSMVLMKVNREVGSDMLVLGSGRQQSSSDSKLDQVSLRGVREQGGSLMLLLHSSDIKLGFIMTLQCEVVGSMENKEDHRSCHTSG